MGRKIFASLVALLFFYVASPLVFPVAMGAVIATLFTPWLEALERRKLSTAGASGLLTLMITIFLLLPSSLLIFVGARGAFVQLEAVRARQAVAPVTGEEGESWVSAFINLPNVHRVLERITEWLPIQIEHLTVTAQELIRAGAAKLAEVLGQLVSYLPGMGVAMAVVVVSVYFFLVDGRRLVHFLRRNSVFSPQETDQLMRAVAGTCRSVILASVVSGAIQASLELLVCLAVGLPNAALVGLLVFLASFIPVVGSAPITFGVAIYQFMVDQNTAGFVLLASAIVVAILDNFIRPMFLKGSANLHPLLAFVAAFGGLQTLGFSGVFLGPIVAAMFVATVQILVRGDSGPAKPAL